MAGPEPNTPWPSTSSSMTQCKPIPLIKSGTSSVAQPVDGTAPDSDRDNFFIVSHACSYLPEVLDNFLESFVPETPKRRSESIHSTPKSQLVLPTSQPRTPVKTLLKKHHHVIIPTLLKEILGPPHGHSHFGSPESDKVEHPSVPGQWKISGLPKHAAAPFSHNPFDHPGGNVDVMSDVGSLDPGCSSPAGGGNGGDSFEEDEDLKVQAALSLYQDAGIDLMDEGGDAEASVELHVGGHFSKEELDEICGNIQKHIDDFAKHHHHSPTLVQQKLNLAFVTGEHHTAGNPWDAFLALN